MKNFLRSNRFLSGLCVGMFALLLIAASPSFQAFNTNQFGTDNSGKVWIRDTPNITNAALFGTLTGTFNIGYANGGTAAATQGAAITNLHGIYTQDNASFFADVTHNIVIAPTGSGYPGQLLVTYDAGTGGTLNGPLWTAGSDGSWRGSLQVPGFLTVFDRDGNDAQALLVKITNGGDNAITIQNQQSNHFSAMRYLDKFGNEVGANGYGNPNAVIYADCNFFEALNDAKGYYFAQTGFITGGMERTTHDFVWYDGASGTNDASANKVFDLNPGGKIIRYNGDILPTSGNGVASLVSAVKATGQTASISTTTAFTSASNALYRVSGVVLVTTAATTGTLTVTVGWTDELGAETSTPVNAMSTSTTRNMSIVPFVISTTASAITYSTTLLNTTGAATYTLKLAVERLE